MFGDSISVYAFRSFPGSTEPQNIGPGWPDRLAPALPPGFAVVNLARGGSWLTTVNPVGDVPSIVDQVTMALQQRPGARAVLVLAGRNDLTHTSDRTLRDAASAIATRARARGAIVGFVTILPVNDKTPYRRPTDPQRVAFNSWLMATFPGYVIDGDKALDRDGNAQLDNIFDSGDGFHLGEAGAQALADAAGATVAKWPLLGR